MQETVDQLSDEDIWNIVTKIFKIYDNDGDGRLNKEEGKEYIKIWSEEELGHAPSDKMIESLFTEIDENRDGFIEKQDVFEHLKRA